MATVLLVEDNEVLARFTARHLAVSLPGVDVQIAASVGLARSLARGMAFDVLIVDRELPDGDGLELGRDLKRQHPTLALIVTSADTHDVLTRAALGLEPSSLLTKPFESDELVGAVAQALGARVQVFSRTALGLPSDPQHAARNRLAALLAGLRAFAADLRDGAHNQTVVLQLVDEYESALVEDVHALTRIISTLRPASGGGSS